MTTTNFSYSSTVQTYTVPALCNKLLIDMIGGASSFFIDSTTAAGGRCQFALDVTPGQVLNVWVGQDAVTRAGDSYWLTANMNGQSGANGYSGGGAGGQEKSGTYRVGGGGGGSSALLTSSGTLIAEAGGGGSSTSRSTMLGGAPGDGGGGGHAGAAGLAGGSNTLPGGGGGGNGGNGGTASGASGNGPFPVGGIGHGTAGVNGGNGTITSGAGGGSGGTLTSGPSSGTSIINSAGTSSATIVAGSTRGIVSITTAAAQGPNLISPAPGIHADSPTAFMWSYSPIVVGNTMTGYVFRFKNTSSGTYSYFDSTNPGTPSATLVTNSATAPGATFAPGIFVNGNNYQWNVANVDQGGQGSWAPSDALLYAQQAPTVTITSPSSAPAVQNPFIQLAYTLAPGEGLLYWAYEVYTDAQVAVAGFAPWGKGFPLTYTYISHSDPTIGRVMMPVPLVNHVTLHVYVQLSDRNNMLAKASTAVTPSYSPPATPSIVAVPSTDINQTPCVAVTVTASNNLLTSADASLETATYTWAFTGTGGTGGSLAQSTAQALDAAHSLLVTLTSTHTGAAVQSGVYPVTAGKSYTALASLFNPSNIGTFKTLLQWYSDSGGTVLVGTTTGGSTSGSSWPQAFCSGVAPIGAITCRMSVVTTGVNSNSGGIYYLDQMGIMPGASNTAWSIGGFSGNCTVSIVGTNTTTGQVHQVRSASVTNQIALSIPNETGTVLDYEIVPGDSYTYVATASAIGAPVSAASASSVPVVLSTSVMLIFDPLNPTMLYAVVHQTGGSLNRIEYAATHKGIGDSYLSVISDTIGGMDGTMTVRIKDLATWRRFIGTGVVGDTTSLATGQRTVCISDPWGGLYYGRLGLAGSGGGGANATITGTRVGGNYTEQWRDIALQFAAQPMPPV